MLRLLPLLAAALGGALAFPPPHPLLLHLPDTLRDDPAITTAIDWLRELGGGTGSDTRLSYYSHLADITQGADQDTVNHRFPSFVQLWIYWYGMAGGQCNQSSARRGVSAQATCGPA